ncbi:MAG: O-antigen ligase family protein, partial [Clostridia bacterium]|nr:O-antigen ligase family protein [Clostridia bacterium]
QAWMDEDMFSDIKMRIYSTLGNPNVLGEYILLVLPVSIGLMWINKNPASKIVYAGISAVMFAALILTFSRGCWIGILFAAVIFITFAAGKLWGLGLLALPVLPMVLPESIINRFASIGDMKDSSTSYRVYIWMGTLSMIKDFWVSGIGMGQEAFTQVYPFYSYNGIVAPHSHNLFLQILVESGIAGIAVFLLIIFFYLRKVMVGYQVGGKGDAMSTMMTAITAGICGFLVQGMFDNSFYNYRVMLVFWCTLAIGRACVYVAEQRRESNDKGN